jgi:glycosyltransferase involved in cell wall biosynthesis
VRIGIYVQSIGNTLGGVDCLAAVLADGLARTGYATEIVHHKAALNAGLLQSVYGVELGGVTTRYIPRQPNPFGTSSNPIRRFGEAKNWHADISGPYDCTISMVTEYPSYCHSPNGILYVVFPIFGGFDRWPFKADVSRNGSRLRNWLSSRYHYWEWGQRLGGYQRRVAISEYTRDWTRRWWGIDCETIYPPVDLSTAMCEKQPVILSVGRFDHWKKHAEMIAAFTEMKSDQTQGWSLTIAGGLDHPDYYDHLLTLAHNRPISLLPDVSRTALRELYGRAGIYWHAAGYGNDDEGHPEQTEHFGITTVEAMGAGCVPVVINKAGQRETVEHGVSGFLWDTPDQLQHYTVQLIEDPALRARMSIAAQERAQRFSRESYVQKFCRLLEETVGQRSSPRGRNRFQSPGAMGEAAGLQRAPVQIETNVGKR